MKSMSPLTVISKKKKLKLKFFLWSIDHQVRLIQYDHLNCGTYKKTFWQW